VRLEVFRRGESLTLNVEIARLRERAAAVRPGLREGGEATPAERPSASLFGLTLAPMSDALRRQYRLHPDAEGLVVTAVDASSDAAGKVRVGDVLEEIAWTRVESLDQAREVADAARASGPVLVTLNRQGQYLLQTLRG
jgi:serine protease Do